MANASVKMKARLVGLTVAIVVSSQVSAIAQQNYYYEAPPSYYRNDTRQGTVTGLGIGAITGALIGGKKNREGGALIGAGIGALTGHAMGSARDAQDARQVAVGSSIAAQANAQAAARAVTNLDLVQMTQAGISDELIISTINTRGGRFDFSPQSLIGLKQSGVSDRVVIAAQQAAGLNVPTPINPSVSVPAPIVVRPSPVIHHYHVPRRHYYHHYHMRW